MISRSPSDKLADLFKLQNLMSDFAKIKRAVYHPNHKAENDPEHSLTLAFAAWHLARDNESLDMTKVIQYAMVHDLVEIYAGDTPAFSEKVASKASREKAALEEIRANFPEFPEICAAIDDYENLANEEAKFVYALDKLMPPIVNLVADDYGWKKHEMNPSRMNDIRKEKVKISPEIEEIDKEVAKLLSEQPDYSKKEEI